MRLYDALEKQKAIKREVSKLRRLFRDLPAETKKAGEGLIHEAAFMRVTLEETKHIINQEGILEHFEQGSQNFLREHELDVYLAVFDKAAFSLSEKLIGEVESYIDEHYVTAIPNIW